MSTSKSYRDILDEYVKSAGIEKAPEGFTQKVMHNIYLEKNAYKPVAKKSYVPFITVAVAGALISASMLIPVKTPEIINKFLTVEKINLKFPDLNELIVLPKIILYVVAGVVILTCFDTFLRAMFQRRKSE
jgi:hypothetical protein